MLRKVADVIGKINETTKNWKWSNPSGTLSGDSDSLHNRYRFLALFTQAGRTNSIIDDKNEATFIAVEEMEKITNLSQQGKTFRKMKAVYLDNNGEELDISDLISTKPATEN